MKKNAGSQNGFTLLEIIVVLAVLGALAAMLTPVVFRYIDDANRTRAQSDAQTIASAIQQMYKDTGRWPFYKVGTSKLSHTVADDATDLTSNATCTTGACTDTAKPEIGMSTGWTLTKLDSIANQLILNTPFGTGTAYPLTGSRAWKGPYLDRVPNLDPWGRSYVVNIINADPDLEGFATQKWVIVASAGPDGILDTSASALGSSNPQAAGDDVVARVK
jgi:prepilin-type N-terminal cleavage/methylation domain-containing protein